MNSWDAVTDRELFRTHQVSGGSPRRALPGARHAFITDVVLVVATLLIGEILVWVGQPLYGAAWYGFLFVALINVVIRMCPSLAGKSGGPGRFDGRVAVLL